MALTDFRKLLRENLRTCNPALFLVYYSLDVVLLLATGILPEKEHVHFHFMHTVKAAEPESIRQPAQRRRKKRQRPRKEIRGSLITYHITQPQILTYCYHTRIDDHEACPKRQKKMRHPFDGFR